MRILAAVQSILAIAFILFGLVALFGIGITGLLFLVCGGIFAGTAALAAEASRMAAAVALAADAVLAYVAARKLGALLTAPVDQTHGALEDPGVFDYLPPSAALVLVAIGAVGVIRDWRAFRHAPWF